MNRRLLFIIDSDPQSSHRPAEAVRIAAGIAAWKQVEVSLYFRGAASLALTDEAESLIDGDNFTRYLPILREAGARVLSGEEMSDEALAAWAAEQTSVARF
jgi:sulfur relay (sulfurtransferase) DsrF/TusC family protein